MPLSIISIFVMHPMVLSPSRSIFLAIYRTSSFVMSWLAGITHKIIVLGSSIYLKINWLLLSYHFCSYFVDILVLSFDSNSGETWEINDGEVGTMSRVDVQYNGIIDDVFVFATHFIGQLFDAFFDQIEITDLLIWNFGKDTVRSFQVLLVNHSDL